MLATVWLGCAVCAISATSAWGTDFDGSKPLLCATIDAHSCDPGQVCQRGLPADLGVPQFLRIDFAKKTVVGPARTTPIRFMETGAGQLLMQGTELGFAWAIALDTADGTMTLSLVNRDDAYMLFGACTPNLP
ncbi:hypothetical protein [Paraburkholderia phenazinium]|jgi:hypothetical protein|uniref:Uncharacterized protein n=1 Tax=Paraburkholderia phenazinium TaxID=60549 RepID=A0A1G8LJP7_9BURK|nr:hypothetical protein [Paraburkholderia phenazinium]SDI55835.1 hypothetical protein SAMN05216466_12618 [Paraburkholderia phenazinium]